MSKKTFKILRVISILAVIALFGGTMGISVILINWGVLGTLQGIFGFLVLPIVRHLPELVPGGLHFPRQP